MFRYLLLSALGCVLAALGLTAIFQESNRYAFGSADARLRVSHIAEGRRIPGLSTSSQNRYLLDCYNDGLYTTAFGFDQDIRSRLLEQCRRHAGEVVAMAPASAFGWFVGSVLAMQQGDTGAFNSWMRRSYETGPNEYWINERRFGIAEDFHFLLEPDILELHRREMAALAQTPGGSRLLAQRYVGRPESRERITAAVESLPAEHQSAFLARVKTATTQAAAN